MAERFEQQYFPPDVIAKFLLGAEVFCGFDSCGCGASVERIDRNMARVLRQRHGTEWDDGGGWMVNCYYHRNMPWNMVSFEQLDWSSDDQ